MLDVVDPNAILILPQSGVMFFIQKQKKMCFHLYKSHDIVADKCKISHYRMCLNTINQHMKLNERLLTSMLLKLTPLDKN